MTNNDKKLFEISCREQLLEIVKESDIINKSLTFTQKILLFDKIKEMPFQEVYNLLFQNEGAREIETKDERDTKYGAAMTAGGVAAHAFKKGGAKYLKTAPKKPSVMAGAAIGAGLMFIYRRITDPCFRQTVKILNPTKRKIAKLSCENEAITKVINKIRTDMAGCSSAPNPERCKDKLAYELNKWRSKYQENLVQITKLRSTQD